MSKRERIDKQEPKSSRSTSKSKDVKTTERYLPSKHAIRQLKENKPDRAIKKVPLVPISLIKSQNKDPVVVEHMELVAMEKESLMNSGKGRIDNFEKMYYVSEKKNQKLELKLQKLKELNSNLKKSKEKLHEQYDEFIEQLKLDIKKLRVYENKYDVVDREKRRLEADLLKAKKELTMLRANSTIHNDTTYLELKEQIDKLSKTKLELLNVIKETKSKKVDNKENEKLKKMIGLKNKQITQLLELGKTNEDYIQRLDILEKQLNTFKTRFLNISEENKLLKLKLEYKQEKFDVFKMKVSQESDINSLSNKHRETSQNLHKPEIYNSPRSLRSSYSRTLTKRIVTPPKVVRTVRISTNRKPESRRKESVYSGTKEVSTRRSYQPKRIVLSDMKTRHSHSIYNSKVTQQDTLNHIRKELKERNSNFFTKNRDTNFSFGRGTGKENKIDDENKFQLYTYKRNSSLDEGRERQSFSTINQSNCFYPNRFISRDIEQRKSGGFVSTNTVIRIQKTGNEFSEYCNYK